MIHITDHGAPLTSQIIQKPAQLARQKPGGSRLRRKEAVRKVSLYVPHGRLTAKSAVCQCDDTAIVIRKILFEPVVYILHPVGYKPGQSVFLDLADLSLRQWQDLAVPELLHLGLHKPFLRKFETILFGNRTEILACDLPMSFCLLVVDAAAFI